MAVGLKNDLGQIPDLVDDFDFAVNEECFSFDECGPLKRFVAAGKPVFQIEYELAPKRFCERSETLGFYSIKKAPNFTLFPLPWTPCS